MTLTKILLRTVALSLLTAGALMHAATVTGTVTNKTTNKPSAGDTVILVDVQAGMRDAAHATTDARGHYTLSEPGNGPYLVRAMHQGAGYFIAAPQGNAPGDITVYDVAAKVNGVSIEDDILDFESENGQLDVTERYVVHNASSPRVTQMSANSFEFVLPANAVLDGAAATRPSGLPTNAIPQPLAQKGHYTFNVPIQPDEGDNDTLFEIHYHLTYNGSYSFKQQFVTPVDNFAVRLPKSMSFAAGTGNTFRPVEQNASLQTFLLKNAQPGKAVEFTVSGNGSLPREDQNAQGGSQTDNSGQDAGGANGGQPGGGIGPPVGGSSPISTKYIWWILGGFALLLVVVAAFLLQEPAAGVVASAATASVVESAPSFESPTNKNAALLNALKEELFALESEKLTGVLTAAEYAEVKTALETVLKRALKRGV